MGVEVKNLKRPAAAPTCGCSSFLKHWEKATRVAADKCSTKGCKRDADVGAHVKKCSKTSKDSWWIVPLCNKCNSSANTDCFELKNRVSFIGAGKKKSCGK